jgi:hypothetical protein
VLDEQQRWTATTLRRFVVLLAALVALLTITEVAAVFRLIPHLEPLSLQTLISTPLFAIGFGGPLLLHLSSLPRFRELAATIVLGCALSGLTARLAHQSSAMQWVSGLGVASTLVLAVRAVRRAGDSTTARLFLLPSLITLLFTLEAAMFLGVISHYRPLTYDGLAFVADAAFGSHVSFDVGRLFKTWPLLAAVCTAIYLAPPPGLMFVYALEAKSKRHPPVDIVTVLVVMGAVGYSLYFLFPVCGPKFAFPQFPFNPPDPATLAGKLIAVPPAPRNAVPSLHMASALVAFMHARRYGWIACAVAAVFVTGTFLATMGTGEHYLVDLLVAVPFTVAMDALLTPSPRRWTIVIACAAIFAAALAVIRFGAIA